MLWQEIPYVLRAMVKKPTFTIAAVLTLVLGIGANTAMFSIISAILLRQPPFENPDQLVTVWETDPMKGIDQSKVAAPTFSYWNDHNDVFEQMALYDVDSLALVGSGEPERLPAAQVSPNFFSVLGVQALVGRTFAPAENQPGHDHVVILSHALWQRRFDADQSILGKTVTLSNMGYTVIGVLPRDFRFIEKADLWTPFSLEDERQDCNSCQFFTVIARLKKDATREQAQAEMANLSRQLKNQQDDTTGARVVFLKDYLVAKVRLALWILFGAVIFVLLIACTNVANLLLARTATRQQEFAVRMALGATRLSLIRLLLIESVIVALIAGFLGLLLARWGISLIGVLIPESVVRDEIVFDYKVLGFTLIVSLLSGLMFGLLPALKASRPDFNEFIKDNARTTTGGLRHVRTRSLLIISEVALSLMLLTGAGLLMKSFLLLQSITPGFDPDNVLTARVFLNSENYPAPNQKAAFFHRAIEQLETLPGVESVSATTNLPLSGSSVNFRFTVEGEQATTAPTEQRQAQYRAISPNYFRTMRIPVLEGREFTEGDGPNNPGVVIVNETMARRLFPEGGALGKRLTIKYSQPTPREIVGIVKDVKHLRLDESPKPEMYVPYLQNPWPSMTFTIRTLVPPNSLVQNVRERIWSVDKNQPVDKIFTMNQILFDAVSQPRLYAFLLALFAAQAFILSAIGIYGVTSYLVSQRTHEIGIRMSLGARPHDILKLVVREGMTNVVIGVFCGLLLSLATNPRLDQSTLWDQLYRCCYVHRSAASSLSGGVDCMSSASTSRH